jgi:hypothetical protein
VAEICQCPITRRLGINQAKGPLQVNSKPSPSSMKKMEGQSNQIIYD